MINMSGTVQPSDPPREAETGDDRAVAPDALQADQSPAELERLIQVRLSTDSMALDLLLTPGSRRFPMAVRVANILRRIASLGIDPLPDEAVVRRQLAIGKENRWLTLAAGSPPVPPVHGNVEVCVPAISTLGKDRFHPRAGVHAGAVIARITTARDGSPGRDLRGRVLPATQARRATVPAGEHTVLMADGENATLVVACDGMISFDQMKFNVRPMALVTARMLAHGGAIETSGSVFVTDHVPSGSKLVTTGDIYVAGDVDQSTLISTAGSITVLGCVTGHHRQHCPVRAQRDVMLASALYVAVAGGQDVYLQTQARNCSITATRHLILLTRLRSALYGVVLRVGGAVMPIDAPDAPPDVTRDERLDFDIECAIPTEIGVWDNGALAFHAGTIRELSVGSARVAVAGIPPITSNKPLYLKFVLPNSPPIHILARTLPPSRDGLTVAGFRQISHQDEAAITAHSLALARTHRVTAPTEGAEGAAPSGHATLSS